MENRKERRLAPRQRRAYELATPEQRAALAEFRERVEQERAINCKKRNSHADQ